MNDNLIFIKQPDDTAWACDCSELLRQRKKPPTFQEWKDKANAQWVATFGCTPTWDELSEGTLAWIKKQEARHEERYNEHCHR